MLGLESDDLGLVLVAIIGALTTLLGGQKLRDMHNASQPPVVAEVAGALISDKSARDIIRSLDRLSDALESHGNCLSENTKSCEDMGSDIRSVGAKIGKLASEIEITRVLSERASK